MNVMSWYKLARFLHLKRIPLVPKFITYLIRLVFGAFIPHTADIGKGTIVGYGGIGIVVHSRAKIGKNCLVNSGVTIGGSSHGPGVATIGDKVYIGSGAKIIGDVNIGNSVVIGANAVVTKNIPDNCLVLGIPAKIAKTNIEISEYF